VGEGKAIGGSVTDPDWTLHCGDRWRDHVLTTTGHDICDVVGPSPRRARDWVAMMRRVSARDMAGVISAVHGQPIAIRRARRGDIVRRGWAIGICRGDRAEFFGGDVVPMSEVDGVWRLCDFPAEQTKLGKHRNIPTAETASTSFPADGLSTMRARPQGSTLKAGTRLS
jgi:hypothetical protein